MHSAVPLKLQISSSADKAQGLFLAFLGNTGCVYSVLQDDIFRHCLSHNSEKQPRAANMYTSLGHGGKHAAVTSLKMLWQNQGTLLFSFTGLAMLSHHLLEPFQEEGHVTQELHKKFRTTMSVQPNQSFPHPTVINEMLFKQTSRQYETLHAYIAHIHTVLWLSEAIPPKYWLTHTLMVPSSCWHHNSCVSQNHPMADLQPSKGHEF